MVAKYSPWIGKKISKIMHEGIRGRKVSRRQATAVAISMARKKGLKAPKRRKGKKITRGSRHMSERNMQEVMGY